MNQLKLLIAVISIIFINPILNSFANEKSDIQWIVSKLTNDFILVDQWSMYASEYMETEKAFQLFNSVVDSSNWTITEENKQTSKEWKAVSSQMSHTETFLLVQPNNENKIYVCYEISGLYDEKKIEIFPELERKIRSIFSTETRLFSYVKGQYKEDNNTLNNKLDVVLDLLQAKEIEGLKEKQFVSISAFTSQLGEGIITNLQEINLQVGLRLEQTNNGWVTHFIVGTPIITIEY